MLPTLSCTCDPTSPATLPTHTIARRPPFQNCPSTNPSPFNMSQLCISHAYYSNHYLPPLHREKIAQGHSDSSPVLRFRRAVSFHHCRSCFSTPCPPFALPPPSPIRFPHPHIIKSPLFFVQGRENTESSPASFTCFSIVVKKSEVAVVAKGSFSPRYENKSSNNAACFPHVRLASLRFALVDRKKTLSFRGVFSFALGQQNPETLADVILLVIQHSVQGRARLRRRRSGFASMEKAKRIT
nr:hypothetical protein CFP56_57629 [Quercus suber]